MRWIVRLNIEVANPALVLRRVRDDSDVLRFEMAAFFEAGGRAIDSSPMYGSSQAVVGYGLQKLGRPPGLFSADKVWTSSGSSGPAQIEESRSLWAVPRFDLRRCTT